MAHLTGDAPEERFPWPQSPDSSPADDAPKDVLSDDVFPDQAESTHLQVPEPTDSIPDMEAPCRGNAETEGGAPIRDEDPDRQVPETASVDVGAQSEAGADELAAIKLALEDIRASLDERILIDRTIAEQAERIALLEDKVTELSADTVRSLLLPPAKDIMNALSAALISRNLKIVALAPEHAQRNHDADIDHIVDCLESSLEALGLEKIEVNPGDRFDSKIAHASDRVETSQEYLDNTVAEVISPAFTFPSHRRATIPAKVKVHRFIPTDQQ